MSQNIKWTRKNGHGAEMLQGRGNRRPIFLFMLKKFDIDIHNDIMWSGSLSQGLIGLHDLYLWDEDGEFDNKRYIATPILLQLLCLLKMQDVLNTE